MGDDMEKVTIEHDQWPRVEGVTYQGSISGSSKAGAFEGWMKDGVRYLRWDGWRESKPKKWVLVDIKIKREGRTLVIEPDGCQRHFHLGKDYRWKFVKIEREVEG